jgi:hypothetical protein
VWEGRANVGRSSTCGGSERAWHAQSLVDVSFVGGFARAGGVTVEEYAAAEADPLAAFAAPVMKHMNADHTE